VRPGDAPAQALDAAQLLDVLIDGGAGHAAGAGGISGCTEQLGLQTMADELAGDLIHTLGACAGTRTDDALQALAGEQQPDAVVHRPASRQDAVADGRKPYGQASGPRLTGDTRQGSKKAITAVRQACVKVTSMLYDCKGRAVALAGTQQSRS